MTKTKQPKPVKAWGIINKHGALLNEFPLRPCVYRTRQEARDEATPGFGERIVRIEIKVLK